MEAAPTREECVALLQFALSAFPRPLATSAVLAVARARGIDDALLGEAAGEQAGSWRGLLPASEPDAIELVRLGWQAAIHDPDVIAGLVLLRRQPVSIAAVKDLRAVAKLRGHPVEDRLARQADASLTEMADRVRRFALDPPDRRVIERWAPVALQALIRPGEHYDDEGLLRGSCCWLVAASGASMHEGWEAAAIKASLHMIEEQRGYEAAYSYGRVRGLDAGLARLLDRAPLESARSWIGSRPAEVHRAALARVRQVALDVRGEAAENLQGWVKELPHSFRQSATRGDLGIFHHRHGDQEPVSPETPEYLEWLREAGEDEIVSAALQVVSTGHPYSRVRGLIEPDHGRAFERAVIARFESAMSTPSDIGRLADCLADLGTGDAARALLRGLSQDAAVAEASERALSAGGSPAVPDAELIALSAASDPAVALRATRALAGRATPVAQALFEELALTGAGPLRWVAVEALGRLGRQSRVCGLLRRALSHAAPHEEQLILKVLPRCAETPQDVAWMLDLPVRAGLEGALSHGAAVLVAASLAEGTIPPRPLLDRLVQLLRDEPGRIRTWRLDKAQMDAIVDALTSHLRTHDPNLLDLARVLDRQIRPVPAGYAKMRQASRMPRASPSGAPARFTEAACFSVLAPECVAPGALFLLEVFVHSKAARDALAQWSSLDRARRFTAGPRALASGSTLDVTVTIEGIALTDPTRQVQWDGDLGMVQFPVMLPADALSPTYPGKATFRLDGIQLAESHFLITVGPVVGVRSEVAPPQQVIRSAFASYATGDRRAVLARIQGMQKAAPFIDIFLDVVSLRSGDDWAERIRSEIKARDVLLLFWSQAASKSPYVDAEWRMALAENGIERISPVPLEGAPVAPPPPELCSLHFNDWTLAVR